jgi:predicted amidohydrolase YtcJ
VIALRPAAPVVLFGATFRRPAPSTDLSRSIGPASSPSGPPRRPAEPDPEAIDVGGRTIVPGFVDAHNHFLATGESLSSIDVRYPNVASCEDLAHVIHDAAESTPTGTWIHAFGFDHAKYDRAPTRRDLDQATTRHPVLAYRSGHHVLGTAPRWRGA